MRSKQIAAIFLVLLLFTPKLFAQIGPDRFYSEDPDAEQDLPEDAPAPKDAEGEEETLSDDDKKSGGVSEEDRELSLSSGELREKFTSGVSFNLGSTHVRELFGIGYGFQYARDWAITSNVGSGKWIMDGEQRKKTYRLKTSLKDVGFGLRYFFTDITSFYVESNITYLFWKGTIEPTGTNSEEDEPLADKLHASFSASGPAFGLKVGWMAIWENGFFIDYCLFGAAKPWLVSEDYTRSSTEAKNAVRRELQTAQIWGLINIGLGWMF